MRFMVANAADQHCILSKSSPMKKIKKKKLRGMRTRLGAHWIIMASAADESTVDFCKLKVENLKKCNCQIMGYSLVMGGKKSERHNW